MLSRDGTWTESHPDNLQLAYDTGGNLTRMVSPTGGRWTVIRSSGLMTALSALFSRRTSFAYDGSSKLKRVRDKTLANLPVLPYWPLRTVFFKRKY